MSKKGKNPKVYSLSERAGVTMINVADEQLDIIADLLEYKVSDDPLDLKLITLLCDSFSSNYHIWNILKVNLKLNLTKDEKTKESVIALPEADLIVLEQAILSRAFSKAQLLKLNYSLTLH